MINDSKFKRAYQEPEVVADEAELCLKNFRGLLGRGLFG